MPPHADDNGSDTSDTEGSPAPAEARSRSQSRRARRRKASANKDTPSKGAKGKVQRTMSSVPEDKVQEARQAQQPQARSQATAVQGNQQMAQAQSEARAPTVEETGMQPFEWIGPDSTSMAGPVTYAKAQRGEIPARPGNPNQSLMTGSKPESNDLMDQDGLKLRLELNIDVEVELKARIQGDLTLALLA